MYRYKPNRRRIFDNPQQSAGSKRVKQIAEGCLVDLIRVSLVASSKKIYQPSAFIVLSLLTGSLVGFAISGFRCLTTFHRFQNNAPGFIIYKDIIRYIIRKIIRFICIWKFHSDHFVFFLPTINASKHTIINVEAVFLWSHSRCNGNSSVIRKYISGMLFPQQK